MGSDRHVSIVRVKDPQDAQPARLGVGEERLPGLPACLPGSPCAGTPEPKIRRDVQRSCDNIWVKVCAPEDEVALLLLLLRRPIYDRVLGSWCERRCVYRAASAVSRVQR